MSSKYAETGEKFDAVLLGSRIRQARIERNLTQADLTDGEITVPYLSMIESGRRTPSTKTLTLILDRLGININDFMDERFVPLSTAHLNVIERAEYFLGNGNLKKLDETIEKLPKAIQKDARVRAIRAEQTRLQGKTEEAFRASYDVLLTAIAESRWVAAESALITHSRCMRETNAYYESMRTLNVIYQLAVDKECPDPLFMATLEIIMAGTMEAVGDLESARMALARVHDKWNLWHDEVTRGRALWNESALLADLGKPNAAFEAAVKARELLLGNSRDIDDFALIGHIADLISLLPTPLKAKEVKVAKMALATLAQRETSMSPTDQARAAVMMLNLRVQLGLDAGDSREFKKVEAQFDKADVHNRLQFLKALVRLHIARGEVAAAKVELKRAAQIVTETKNAFAMFDPIIFLAQLAEEVGDNASALVFYKYSHRISGV